LVRHLEVNRGQSEEVSSRAARRRNDEKERGCSAIAIPLAMALKGAYIPKVPVLSPLKVDRIKRLSLIRVSLAEDVVRQQRWHQ
jgi:hypothetical protein